MKKTTTVLVILAAALAASVGLNVHLMGRQRRAEANYRAAVRIMDAMAVRLAGYATADRVKVAAAERPSQTVAWSAVAGR